MANYTEDAGKEPVKKHSLILYNARLLLKNDETLGGAKKA